MSLSSLSSLSSEEEQETQPRRTPRTRRNVLIIRAMEILNDGEFRERFRLKKASVSSLFDKIGQRLATLRMDAIQPMDQILIASNRIERFYATGSFQIVVGDLFNISQPTVHRVVQRVTVEIARLRGRYIKMPETRLEMIQTAREFHDLAGFPRVIGAVDCTHIKINSPGGAQAESFRNRKTYFSLNVQMVCDAKLKILNIIARWPGSVHDSTFNDSPLCALFEQGHYENMMLLGDSGYPCRPYLLTPLLNPAGPAQEAYNRAQISTRNPIERLYGVLKRRFPCLQMGLRLKVINIPPVIVACAVLHNIALLENDDFEIEIELEDPFQDSNVEYHNTSPENFIVRNRIIEEYFS